MEMLKWVPVGVAYCLKLRVELLFIFILINYRLNTQWQILVFLRKRNILIINI